MPALQNILAKRPKPVVVDVETTGFGAHDRIVEIAIITLDPETWETETSERGCARLVRRAKSWTGPVKAGVFV